MGKSQKKHKKPVTENFVETKKIARIEVDIEKYNEMSPVWSFTHFDVSHDKWSLCNCPLNHNDLINKLISFERMKWKDIRSQTGGKKRGPNNHPVAVATMILEAQKRLDELKIIEDELFSLRLDGKHRLYGIVRGNIFYAVWWDSEHEICLSEKRHT